MNHLEVQNASKCVLSTHISNLKYKLTRLQTKLERPNLSDLDKSRYKSAVKEVECELEDCEKRLIQNEKNEELAKEVIKQKIKELKNKLLLNGELNRKVVMEFIRGLE